MPELWHLGRMQLKVSHNAGTLQREVFGCLSFILQQIASGRKNRGVGVVSSNTSARPKVTAPCPASLSPLNQSLPLNMNHTSVSPLPQQEITWRVKEHTVIICLPSTVPSAPTTPRQCQQTLKIILEKKMKAHCLQRGRNAVFCRS